MADTPSSGFVHPRIANYEADIKKLREAAREPHYKFVQFLTALSAGMISLSAPTQAPQSSPNFCIGMLSAWALIGMTMAVLAGVYALYGEKQAFERRWQRMEHLRTKHEGDVLKADEELNKDPLIRPHASHRWAFHILWLSWLAGVLLLALSKIGCVPLYPQDAAKAPNMPQMTSKPHDPPQSPSNEPSPKEN